MRYIHTKPAIVESVLVPKGTSSKAFFVVGGVGCIINIVAGIWHIFTTLYTLVTLYIPARVVVIFFPCLSYWAINDILFAIGLILASVGYLGMGRCYGSGVGLASFAVGVVTGVLFLLAPFWGENLASKLDWVLRVCIGVTIFQIFYLMMILWGATHITTRRFTGKSKLSLATGIMFIITAVSLEISATILAVIALFVLQLPWQDWIHFFLMDWYGWSTLVWTSLFLVSEILAAILFFMMKVQDS